MELVKADRVSFSYARKQAKPVLRDVSLAVRRGEVLSLLGPNGSGKTTLLKVILGLHRPNTGDVFFQNRPIAGMNPKELARKIAYVPQSHKMGFAYRVLDVVLTGRMPHQPFFSRPSKEDRNIALHCLERLSIAHLKDRSYTEISGGERQLTLIGRALAQEAGTLVMDEPANNLDYGNQIRLIEQIGRLSQEGVTFILSTHFPDHALWLASRVIMLQEGVLIADGKPEDVMNDEALSRLYNADITLLHHNGSLKTCVPRSVLTKPHDLSRHCFDGRKSAGELSRKDLTCL